MLTHGDLGVVPPRIPLPADPDQRDLALAVATRSLMARGLVTPEPAEAKPGPAGAAVTQPEGAAPRAAGPPDAATWAATEPLGLTLCLRALAPCVLALQRVLGPHPGGAPDPSVATRYLHLHSGIAVLEDVTDHGMHSLLAIEREHWERAVAEFIVPPDAEPGAGPVRVLGAGEGAAGDLLADLGHPTVLVEAGALLPDGVESLMVALGPGGTFLSQDSQRYHPTTPGQAVTELLRQTEATLLSEDAVSEGAMSEDTASEDTVSEESATMGE